MCRQEFVVMAVKTYGKVGFGEDYLNHIETRSFENFLQVWGAWRAKKFSN